jgi:hypothetical protein
MTGEPVGPEELYRYYRKVCLFLDTEEGKSTVICHVTMDQLDMLLFTLPAKETFAWGRRSDRSAEELRAQIMSFEGAEETPRVTALPSGWGHACWHHTGAPHTIRLGVHSDSGEKRVEEEIRVLASTGGAAALQLIRRSHSTRHRLSLPAAGRCEGEAPGGLCLRGGGDHHRGREEAAPLGKGSVPIRQGAHAMDGYTSGPDRTAHRPG